MDKVKRFREIVNQMADLYEKKNKNYGDSFGKLFKDLGPIAGLVPLHNKLDRLTNLVQGGKNDFESLEDTFKDLACYAIMNLIEIEAKEKQEIKPDPENKTINLELIDKNPCSKCYKMYEPWQGIVNPCSDCKYYHKTCDVYTTNIDDLSSTNISNYDFT